MKTLRINPRFLALLLPFLLLSNAGADIVISEFMALNERSITDEDGDNSDWIEIRNTGPGTVNIGGYYLTDSEAEPTKWQIPSRTLTNGAYLIVFASGKDRTPPVGELHTNFSLNADGEYLALIGPDGTSVLTEFAPYPEQYEDISYGTGQIVSTSEVLSTGASCRWLVPTGAVANWQSAGFNDATWSSAQTGIGYDNSGNDYQPFIGAGGNIGAVIGNNTCVYVRVPFNIADASTVVRGRLRMQFDDGFVAHFNNAGIIASANAPSPAVWNSVSTVALGTSTGFTEFPVNTGSLQNGANVLAIHGINQSNTSSDLLITPVLELDIAQGESNGYMPEPSPSAANTEPYDGFVKDTTFSMKRGFYESPVTVEVATETAGAEIRYTLDGSEPTETNGQIYTTPLTFTDTTTLRVAAFRDGFYPTNVDTNTYIFPASVVTQPSFVSGFPATWGTEYDYLTGQFTTTPVPADYEMDTAVTTDPQYSGIVETALKSTLPVVCITADRDDMFSFNGLYSNARESSTEIPISLEYFDPNTLEDFQQNSGIRIHGGNARSHPKKPFRLYFKREYGKGKLDFPLFPGSAVDSFDQLILRPGGHDGWSVPFGNESTDLAPHALYMRDQFIRRTETEMGILSPRGKYVHVYINGLYWGMYDLHERVNAQYFAAHRGGDEADWDVYHHRSTTAENFALVDGTQDAYVNLQNLAAAGITSEGSYQAIQEYLDIDSYIDAMISRMWTGDWDWDGDMFLKNGAQEADVSYFTNKNWYAGRKSRNGAGKFFFFAWDAEMSMGTHLMVNLGPAGIPSWFSYPPPQRITGFDSTRVNTPWAPAYPYNFLRRYKPFQIRFGDRLQKHFFGDGAMSTAANQARAADMEATLDLPIVAESARWGDVNEDIGNGSDVLTRNTHWRPEVNWWKNTFLAGRNQTVLDQFRAIDLYPEVDAALFSTHGGPVAAGSQITLSAPEGNIYYTTDGSEPYSEGQFATVGIVDEDASIKYLIPSTANGGDSLAGVWKGAQANEATFNDSSWSSGTMGIGYESSGTNYAPFINTDIPEMEGAGTSVFVRSSFLMLDTNFINSLDGLRFSARYDDGFVAYLNGFEIARSNAPTGIPAWNDQATGINPDTAAEVYQAFEVTADIPSNLLRFGWNRLAVHMLNAGSTSSDLLLQMKLEGVNTVVPPGPSPTAQLYTGPITLSNTQTIKVRVEDPNTGEWSALSEAQFLVGTLANANNIVISELNYRPREPVSTTETSISTNRDDYEWIEVMNVSAEPVDITNMNFSQGITFTFSGGVLQPGEKVLVVRNRAAFLARYGAAMDSQIAGEFENGTGLSNGGERVTLLGATGSTIHSFSYNDNDPWPTIPDDYGHSLELLNPDTVPDHGQPANWTGSLDVGGTPGTFAISNYDEWAAVYFDTSDPAFALISSPAADFDGDGLLNFLEYVLGTDPASGEVPNGYQPLEVATVAGPGGQHVAFTYRQRPESPATDFVTSVETSADGVIWSEAATETSSTSAVDGSVFRSFRSNASFSSDDAQLMRVRATQVVP